MTISHAISFAPTGNDILCITEDARAALEAMEGPICVVCTSGGQGVGKVGWGIAVRSVSWKNASSHRFTVATAPKSTVFCCGESSKTCAGHALQDFCRCAQQPDMVPRLCQSQSELLNRAILGSSASGFPVGGTTGIWMWSKPIKAQASDGSDVNLLLLDAAGTVNERSFSGSFEINADIESSGIINNLQTIAFRECPPRVIHRREPHLIWFLRIV